METVELKAETGAGLHQEVVTLDEIGDDLIAGRDHEDAAHRVRADVIDALEAGPREQAARALASLADARIDVHQLLGVNGERLTAVGASAEGEDGHYQSGPRRGAVPR